MSARKWWYSTRCVVHKRFPAVRKMVKITCQKIKKARQQRVAAHPLLAGACARAKCHTHTQRCHAAQKRR